MNACAGFLLLGLCLPIPGLTADEVHQQGWVLTNDDPNSTTRYGGVWMKWDNLALYVYVNVDRGRVQRVHILDAKNRSLVTMQGWLKSHCRADGNQWACRIGKRRFEAARCAKGWLLVPENQLNADAGVSELCALRELLLKDF
jgi:hypothetical protein